MLTTQVGTRSNFVGTHLWNVVDDNEVGNFESSSKFFSNDKMNLFLVDSVLEIGPTGWEKHELEISSENVHVHKQQELELHEYQRYLAESEGSVEIGKRTEFDWDTVRFWSDFWKSREFPMNAEFLAPGTEMGEYFWASEKMDFGESKLRNTLENMDAVKSHQMIGNISGGFARHTIELAEFLHDELPKKPWLEICPVEISDSGLINFARLYTAISEHATIVLHKAQSETVSIFTQTAPLGCGLYALQDQRDLPTGLVDFKFSIFSADKAVWRSSSSGQEDTEICTQIFRSITAPVPFPRDFVDAETGEVQVRGVIRRGESEIFSQTLEALRNFRLSGGLKKTSDVEIDDWTAMEELVEEEFDQRTNPDEF